MGSLQASATFFARYSASNASTSKGKWGPCCSIAPVGKIATSTVLSLSSASGQVSSDQRNLLAKFCFLTPFPFFEDSNSNGYGLYKSGSLKIFISFQVLDTFLTPPV